MVVWNIRRKDGKIEKGRMRHCRRRDRKITADGQIVLIDRERRGNERQRVRGLKGWKTREGQG